ncbi:MAG: type II secretion system protein [Planctomycetota bacterium]|nr:MAG: type II secretion system protein [Planctomycetota bacterium]
MWQRRQDSCRGMTLAELMVVVAIIGILGSLLLSVVGGVRRSAVLTACLSNLRQVGMAAGMYADDHGGRYPASRNHGITDPDQSPAWFYRLPSYVDRPDTRGRNTVFQSPSYQWRDPEIFTNASPKSYKMNDALSRGGRRRHPTAMGIPDAHEVVLFANAVAGETGMGQWGHLVPSGVDFERHGGRTTVLFLDGHGSAAVREPEDGDARSVLHFASRRWRR